MLIGGVDYEGTEHLDGTRFVNGTVGCETSYQLAHTNLHGERRNIMYFDYD